VDSPFSVFRSAAPPPQVGRGADDGEKEKMSSSGFLFWYVMDEAGSPYWM